MKKYIYIASFQYGKAILARAELIKETPKQYHIGEYENLIDEFYYLPNRLHKENYMVFAYEADAVSYLMGEVEKSIEGRKRQIEKLRVLSNNLMEYLCTSTSQTSLTINQASSTPELSKKPTSSTK